MEKEDKVEEISPPSKGHLEDRLATIPGKKDNSIRVSLQLQNALKGSRKDRRQALHASFDELAQEYEDLEILPETLSVSGQVIEATLPASQFKDLCEDIERKELRVDRLEARQVVPPFSEDSEP